MSKNEEVVEINATTIVIAILLLVIVVLLIVMFTKNGEDQEGDSEEIRGIVEESQESGDFEDPDITKTEMNLDLDEAIYLGNLEAAKYAIVEFSDFQCPFCEKHANETLPLILETYIADDVIYVFNDMPIYPPNSTKLTMAGFCIFEDSGIDEFMDYRKIAYGIEMSDDESIFDAIKDLDINQSNVRKCYEAEIYSERIEENISLGNVIGIQGVPGFVIGKLSDDGKIEGYLVPGAYPLSQFEQILSSLKE